MLALRLPAEIEIRLEKLAKSTGRTKSFYAREAIVAHLNPAGKYIVISIRRNSVFIPTLTGTFFIF